MQVVDGAPVYSATDLVGFVECGHLTDLERAAVAGLVQRPMRPDPQLDRVAKRGEQHEERFLEELRAEGLSVEDIPWNDSDVSRGERMRANGRGHRGGGAARSDLRTRYDEARPALVAGRLRELTLCRSRR